MVMIVTNVDQLDGNITLCTFTIGCEDTVIAKYH